MFISDSSAFSVVRRAVRPTGWIVVEAMWGLNETSIVRMMIEVKHPGQSTAPSCSNVSMRGAHRPHRLACRWPSSDCAAPANHGGLESTARAVARRPHHHARAPAHAHRCRPGQSSSRDRIAGTSAAVGLPERRDWVCRTDRRRRSTLTPSGQQRPTQRCCRDGVDAADVCLSSSPGTFDGGDSHVGTDAGVVVLTAGYAESVGALSSDFANSADGLFAVGSWHIGPRRTGRDARHEIVSADLAEHMLIVAVTRCGAVGHLRRPSPAVGVRQAHVPQ